MRFLGQKAPIKNSGQNKGSEISRFALRQPVRAGEPAENPECEAGDNLRFAVIRPIWKVLCPQHSGSELAISQ
jgi:hypothetical protein